jgi:hypothetical protein
MTTAAAAGAFGAMDIIGEHSYQQLTQPEAGLPERCRQVRALLAKHGKTAPIWHTEQGTGGDGDGYLAGLLTEPQCASSLVRAYVCAIASGVEKFFWFSAQTSPTYGWGVFYEDYVPRPRLVALNGLASQLEGARFQEQLKLGEQAVAHVFHRGEDAVVAAWDLARPVTLSLPSLPTDVRIIDMMGNIRDHSGPGEVLKVRLRRQFLVYLVFEGATAAEATQCMSRAVAAEDPFAHIEIAKADGAGAVDVRITNQLPTTLDAVVTVSCRPPLNFERVREFVHDLAPGKSVNFTFRGNTGAGDADRTVTVTVASGRFELRTITARKTLAF